MFVREAELPRDLCDNSPGLFCLLERGHYRDKIHGGNQLSLCEIEHNALFHNASRFFVPAKPKNIEVDSEVAKHIRQLRESRKENQTAFARVLGVLPSNVSKWEMGKNCPQPRVFAQLANLAEGEARTFFQEQAGVLGGTQEFPERQLTEQAKRSARMAFAFNTVEKKRGIAWNPELLALVIETVSRKLKQRGRTLSDARFAELCVLFYEFCSMRGTVDSDMVERLIKIA